MSFRGFGALSALEIAGGVTHGESVVAGHVARAEARSAEAGFDNGTALYQRGGVPVFDECQIGGLTAGIDGEIESSVPRIFVFENVGGGGDIVVSAARATRDYALRNHDFAVLDFVGEAVFAAFQSQQLAPLFFRLAEDFFGICDDVGEFIHVGRVERQRNHRFDKREVYDDGGVVKRTFLRHHGFVFLFSAEKREVLPHFFVGAPHGTQTRTLRGHDVYAVAVLYGKSAYTLSHELENGVFDETVCKHRADERKRNVLRPDPLPDFTFELDGYHFGICNVVCTFEQLFDKFGTSLSYCHCAQRAVSRVAVAAENHFAGSGEHFAHIAVNDGNVGGNVYSAVLLGGGKPENVVVLVDCAAHRAKAVVAVGEHIRQRELFETACARRLDYADISDVVRSHGVEAQTQCGVVARRVVRGQHGICHCAFFGGRKRSAFFGRTESAVLVNGRLIDKFNHKYLVRGQLYYVRAY